MNTITIEKMMWVATFLYWLAAAFFTKKTTRRQDGWQRIVYILCCVAAFGLLFQDLTWFRFLYMPLGPHAAWADMVGLLLCAAGLIFAVTARIYLGKNWSGRITIKENHELIRTGPYRITRNPIYTGFLFAFLGCCLSLGYVKGWIGFLFLIVCLHIKISQEEIFMQDAFGDRFRAYRMKVKKLIPLIY